jgi:sec-independent protein translocase protein TatC
MSKTREDEIFKDSVMTFGEHLNELRGALWRAILGMAVGVLVGFFVANWIVKFIASPLESALKKYYLELAEEHLPGATKDELKRVTEGRMVFERVYIDPRQLADALGKTRSEVVDQPTATAPNAEPDLQEILIWHSIDNDPRTRTKSLSGQEPFMIWLKAAFIAGLVISSPWVFYQLWMFVAAGLYPTERKYVHIYLPFSIGLFIFGVIASSFVFAPILKFFLSFNRSMGIEPEPRISEWLTFVLFLPLGFGLAFQLPLVMLFLERIGVFTVASYLRQWRISVLVIWIIAAIITPGDPYSIFFLGVPMMGLFFGGILLCKWWPREGR